MTRPHVHPVGFMCRTINSRRTEGKLGDRRPGMFRPMATLIAQRWGAGLTVLAALVAAGCAVNPATGSRQLMLISESQEIAMGREYDQEVAASIGLYPDSALQRWIQQFGARLAATSERPNLPWTFHVVDDPVVNAFALPGPGGARQASGSREPPRADRAGDRGPAAELLRGRREPGCVPAAAGRSGVRERPAGRLLQRESVLPP